MCHEEAHHPACSLLLPMGLSQYSPLWSCGSAVVDELHPPHPRFRGGVASSPPKTTSTSHVSPTNPQTFEPPPKPPAAGPPTSSVAGGGGAHLDRSGGGGGGGGGGSMHPTAGAGAGAGAASQSPAMGLPSSASVIQIDCATNQDKTCALSDLWQGSC